MYKVISPGTVTVGEEVVIEDGAVIHPGNVLSGRTVVRRGAVLYPNNIVEDSDIGENAEITASAVRGAAVGAGAKVGPFANLRAGTKVGENCRIGDFVELKNAEVGANTKICHLAYVGDARIGRGANVGCGVIFCNFDGKDKHFTEVGDGAFIGSNVNLVAPVRVGARAFIAAGTTVTRDVPEGACVIGRVRQQESEAIRKKREGRMGELFGTDGIRGVVGEGLTSRTAFALGNALSRLKSSPAVVLGRDTRVSSDMLALAVAAGVTSGGGRVLDGGVLPTAAVSYFVRKRGADLGVVVSASHNPARYNGLKVFGGDGRKLPEKQEKRVEKTMGEYVFAGPLSMGRCSPLDGREEYADSLASACPHSLKGKKIALDCANGAAGAVAPALFERLGAKVFSVCTGGGADINEGCGALHPERVRALTLETGADAGFAYDGDADRLVACDEKGNIVDGDKILCVFAAKLEREGKLREKVVVGTAHTNTGAENYLKKLGVRLIRTDIGDKFVSEAMQKSGAALGGEQSGHIILADHAVTGDGILTSVCLAGLLAEKKLSKLADIRLMPQVNACVKVKDKVRVLGDEYLRTVIDRARQGVLRLVVRASGTEPVVRIFAEAENKKAAKAAVERVRAEILAREG